MALKKEKENKELKVQVKQIQEKFDRELAHTNDILPRYRESLEKLKQNSRSMKLKIKELQDSKECEKQEKEKKIKKVKLRCSHQQAEQIKLVNQLNKLNKIMNEEQKESTSLVQEVQQLKGKNHTLKKKLNEYKRMVDDQESIIRDLKKEMDNKKHKEYILYQQRCQNSNSYSPTTYQNTEKEQQLSQSFNENKNHQLFQFSNDDDYDQQNFIYLNKQKREKYLGDLNIMNEGNLENRSKQNQKQQRYTSQSSKEELEEIIFYDESQPPFQDKIHQMTKAKEQKQKILFKNL